MKEHEEWFARARSCLALAKTSKNAEILREDLCFQAQQSVEKSLKAVQIRYPGDYTPVSEEEYAEAIRLAEECYDWAIRIVRK